MVCNFSKSASTYDKGRTKGTSSSHAGFDFEKGQLLTQQLFVNVTRNESEVLRDKA